MNTNVENPVLIWSYKDLQLSSAFYMTFIILIMLIENKINMISSFKTLSGTFILPLFYAISDIITEVYDYRDEKANMDKSSNVIYFQ